MDSKLFSSNQMSAVFSYYLLEQNGVRIYFKHAKCKTFQETFKIGVRNMVGWINSFSWQDSNEGYSYWIEVVMKMGYYPNDKVETFRYVKKENRLPFPSAVEMFFY